MRRAPSRTWVAAGVLIVASTILPVVAGSLAASIPGLSLFDALLFAAALGLLALGAPSVTARRHLGTGALLALAVWTVAFEILWILPPDLLSGTFGTVANDVDSVVAFALALIAAVSVLRAGIVRRPWAAAPLWALAAVAVPQVVLAVLATSVTTQDAALAFYPIWIILRVAAGLFLGILAIVLGITRETERPSERSESVYSGGPEGAA